MKGFWPMIGFWGWVIMLLVIAGFLLAFWGDITPPIAKAFSNLPTSLQNT